jgi:probable rRNA maturation factor
MTEEPAETESAPTTDGLDVFCANEQDAHEIDVARWQQFAERVLADERTAQKLAGEFELAVIFVDETSMTDLNSRFREVNTPTDVLAFPMEDAVREGRWPDSSSRGPTDDDELPEDMPTMLGDVVICPAVAYRNAPEHAGTYEDELSLLVIHGILHLFGMDHEDDEDAAEMEAREADLLARYHRPLAVRPRPEGAS